VETGAREIRRGLRGGKETPRTTWPHSPLPYLVASQNFSRSPDAASKRPDGDAPLTVTLDPTASPCLRARPASISAHVCIEGGIKEPLSINMRRLLPRLSVHLFY